MGLAEWPEPAQFPILEFTDTPLRSQGLRGYRGTPISLLDAGHPTLPLWGWEGDMDSSNTGDHVAGCYLLAMHQAPDSEGSRLFQPLRCGDLTVPEKVVLPLVGSRAPACLQAVPLPNPLPGLWCCFCPGNRGETPFCSCWSTEPSSQRKLTVQRPSQHPSFELSPASKSGQLN